MTKINELKGKVCGKLSEGKAWIGDHKAEFVVYGIPACILVGSIVLGQHNNKKCKTAWRAAKKAYENGQLDSNFGPYKVMRFFEPVTGEFIGETMCHEKAVEAFLKLK